MKARKRFYFGVALLGALLAVQVHAADPTAPLIQVTVDWSKSTSILNTVQTVMVVPNPILRRTSGVRDAAFAALKELRKL